MNIPQNLKYTKSHEWIKETGKNTYKIGLTDYAQQELGDLVFVNLPAVGDNLIVEESLASVESVKAVEDVYSPFTGTVLEINEDVLDDAALINSDCYDAWLVEVGEVSSKEVLLTAEEYEGFLKEEG